MQQRTLPNVRGRIPFGNSLNENASTNSQRITNGSFGFRPSQIGNRTPRSRPFSPLAASPNVGATGRGVFETDLGNFADIINENSHKLLCLYKENQTGEFGLEKIKNSIEVLEELLVRYQLNLQKKLTEQANQRNDNPPNFTFFDISQVVNNKNIIQNFKTSIKKKKSKSKSIDTKVKKIMKKKEVLRRFEHQYLPLKNTWLGSVSDHDAKDFFVMFAPYCWKLLNFKGKYDEGIQKFLTSVSGGKAEFKTAAKNLKYEKSPSKVDLIEEKADDVWAKYIGGTYEACVKETWKNYSPHNKKWHYGGTSFSKGRAAIRKKADDVLLGVRGHPTLGYSVATKCETLVKYLAKYFSKDGVLLLKYFLDGAGVGKNVTLKVAPMLDEKDIGFNSKLFVANVFMTMKDENEVPELIRKNESHFSSILKMLGMDSVEVDGFSEPVKIHWYTPMDLKGLRLFHVKTPNYPQANEAIKAYIFCRIIQICDSFEKADKWLTLLRVNTPKKKHVSALDFSNLKKIIKKEKIEFEKIPQADEVFRAYGIKFDKSKLRADEPDVLLAPKIYLNNVTGRFAYILKGECLTRWKRTGAVFLLGIKLEHYEEDILHETERDVEKCLKIVTEGNLQFMECIKDFFLKLNPNEVDVKFLCEGLRSVYPFELNITRSKKNSEIYTFGQIPYNFCRIIYRTNRLWLKAVEELYEKILKDNPIANAVAPVNSPFGDYKRLWKSVRAYLDVRHSNQEEYAVNFCFETWEEVVYPHIEEMQTCIHLCYTSTSFQSYLVDKKKKHAFYSFPHYPILAMGTKIDRDYKKTVVSAVRKSSQNTEGNHTVVAKIHKSTKTNFRLKDDFRTVMVDCLRPFLPRMKMKSGIIDYLVMRLKQMHNAYSKVIPDYINQCSSQIISSCTRFRKIIDISDDDKLKTSLEKVLKIFMTKHDMGYPIIRPESVFASKLEDLHEEITDALKPFLANNEMDKEGKVYTSSKVCLKRWIKSNWDFSQKDLVAVSKKRRRKIDNSEIERTKQRKKVKYEEVEEEEEEEELIPMAEQVPVSMEMIDEE